MKINPNLQMVEKPLPNDDPKQRQPVINLAQQQLKWMPKTTLEQGLSPTIEFFYHFLQVDLNSSAIDVF